MHSAALRDGVDHHGVCDDWEFNGWHVLANIWFTSGGNKNVCLYEFVQQCKGPAVELADLVLAWSLHIRGLIVVMKQHSCAAQTRSHGYCNLPPGNKPRVLHSMGVNHGSLSCKTKGVEGIGGGAFDICQGEFAALAIVLCSVQEHHLELGVECWVFN